MKFPSLLSALPLSLSLSSSETAGSSSSSSSDSLSRRPCTHQDCDLQNSLFSWIESNGGYISPKVELSTGTDPNWNIRGVFATSEIEEGEQIFSLPPTLQLCDEDMCGLVNKLKDELQKGSESFWWPYISAMEDHLVDLPSIWNEQERSLLSGLAPGDWQRHLIWFEHTCEGEITNAHHLRAMLLVVARSNGNDQQACMSPFYDSLNHANGNLVNTVNHQEGDQFQKLASQPIAAGQQVFNSFGESDVGRLFRDYGFIAQYPRTWVFPGTDGETYAFECFDENGYMTIDTNPYNSPNQHNPETLAEQIRQHLDTINANPPPTFDDNDPNLDPWRTRMASEYRGEYIHAMNTALEACNSLLATKGEI